VSRASDKLLTVDWLLLRNFNINARLLILLEEDNFVTVPESEVVFLMETDEATSAMLIKG
jgi:hypothetical protein